MTELFSRPERKRRLRGSAKWGLLAFTEYTKPDYVVNWHHRILAEKLDRVARGECRRLMVFMPPQHGKSELVSRRFPAFLLGRNPDLRLIACSHTNDLAVAMNRNVQRIMASSCYERVFSRVKFNRSRRTATAEASGFPSLARRAYIGSARRRNPPTAADQTPIAARRTMDLFEMPGHRGSLLSAGVGNAIVGNSADGAIIDDPFGKREDAESPVMRQKIWDWYTSDLCTRLSKNGWIVLTHTRWHRDDLAGRLLRKMADRSADQWEILNLPAIREEGPGDPFDTRLPGGVLWPDFKSAADLEAIRRQDPRTFAALYQQSPSDASDVEWAAEFFGEYIWVPPEKWPKKFRISCVCVDASKGRSDKQGDYSAIVFVGLAEDGLMYVDAQIERIPLDQIVRKSIVFCDQTRPNMVGIEAEQFQELLVYEFDRQAKQGRGIGFPLYSMTLGGVPKTSRIRRLSQYITAREFRFRADSPGCRLLVDQLMDFPFADHDDGPDALEMCMRLPGAANPSRETCTYLP